MITLCHSSDIAEGTSKGFEVGDHFLFAVRKNGTLYLYRNACPHLGIQLEWKEHEFLDADASLIQCSMHGALFRIHDGECVMGPCQGQSLQTIPFSINDDQLMVSPQDL